MSAADKTLANLEARVAQLEAIATRSPSRQPFPFPYDPAPDDWGWRFPRRFWDRPRPGPEPEPGDPVPFDISRFTRSQLELTREGIKGEMIRLEGVLKIVESQLGSMSR
ncbi:MAG: hypothetical protein EYC70_05245 [Planctomycetota bacterium]|nr:MAG: hypothetical protein EYC70_05245 [Planctomycetota bacterium]